MKISFDLKIIICGEEGLSVTRFGDVSLLLKHSFLHASGSSVLTNL